MFRGITQPALITALSTILFTTSWAQPQSVQIDSEHSTASLMLVSASGGSSWNAGIAQVSGIAKLDSGNPAEDFLNLTIYPARQASRLLNPDGSLRSNGSADLSRYTVMSFHSDHATLNRDGGLEISGELTIAYITRRPIIYWSNAYDGPAYDGLAQQNATHTATFILDSQSAATSGANPAAGQISAQATITGQEFPNLRTALLDPVWPIVVEDEHCEMPPPRASVRDYSGAICTGRPVLPTSSSQAAEYYFKTDYPGPNQISPPPGERATIQLRLRLSR